MACSACGEKPKKDNSFTKAVVEIDNPGCITLIRKVVVPASMGDDTTVPPAVGKYKNVVLYYEANSKTYLYSSDGIPTQLVNGVTDYEAAVNLPQINGVTLLGNKSAADLELADAPMIITVADGNTSWSGADTAEDVYNFFLNKGKVNIVFNGGENYAYEIASAAYIPEEEKMMCTLAVATATTVEETTEFDGNALFGTMTLYTADKAIDVSQIELQPKLFVTDFTGLDLNYNELSGVPATTYSIGMIKSGDGLEVASDGTLSISEIEQYAHFFDTVADMKAATNLIAGSYAQTLGYYTKNDGGKALYAIVGTEPSTYHFPIGDNLYAVLIASNVNVDQLGANGGNQPLSYYFDTLEEAQAVYPNATALTELIGGVAIQCAIDYFYNKDIYFSNNTYYTNTQLTVTDPKRIHFIGTNFGKSVIKRTDEGTSESNNIILSFSRVTNSPNKNVIENIDFIGPHSGNDTSEATLNTYYTIGVDLNYSSYNVFKNCAFMYLKSGVHATYSWTIVFDNCYFDRNNDGIDTYSSSAFNDVEINHCYFVNNNRGLSLGEGRSQLVINCDIEKNNLNGLRRTNSGDIQIINTYFEDDIFIPVAQSAVQNILITGCSFYQNSTNADFYTPIRYDGEADVTQVTIMNCNFIDGNSGASANNSAISEYSGSEMRPVLMNNTTVNMREYNPSGMKGIHIKNGLIHNYLESSFAVNYINGTSGGETSLALNGSVYYRLNVPVSGTHSIKLPTVPIANRYFNTRFQMIVGSNNDSGRAGDISLIPDDSSSCDVTGHTTITYADANKILDVIYEGEWSDKSHWSVTISG